MRNPSPRTSSVRPLSAALLLGAALVITEAAAPAAHASPRSHPGVARRLIHPQRPARVRASRAAVRIRPRIARAPRPLIPVTDPVWGRLRRCESGGRYDINTGNGFFGAYQFVHSTWRGLGFTGMPHHAPPHVQDEAAQKLQARSGWGQWPACTRRLGLR